MQIKEILYKIKKRVKKIILKCFLKKEPDYKSVISRKAPWVYIAYISDVFFHTDDEEYMNSHQNKREAIIMVQVFNRIGYNVYVQNFNATNALPNIPTKIIFGHSPGIERAKKKYKKALVVDYATGCYNPFQNQQERYITDLINAKYGTSFPYERQVAPNKAHIIADKILYIGSQTTANTYPQSVQHKLTPIHQSSQVTKTIQRIEYAPENEYFFMSSSGMLLRGISLLVDYFMAHPDKKINIVGPIEPYLVFVEEHFSPPNIIIHGFLDINSEKIISIMTHCNFIIYPTGSDSGCPGSVINAMKNGLIPIVSQWAAFDEIGDYGFLMDRWDVNSIEDGIRWAESISPTKCSQMKKACAKFASTHYSIEKFSQEFESFFRTIKKQQNTFSSNEM